MVLAALAVMLVLCLGLLFVGWLLRPGQPAGSPTAVFTVITAPTSTAAPAGGLLPSPTATNTGLIVGGIGVGMYVQISGTEGDGLRLRSSPGTDASPLFLGREAEVFKVTDGPREASGYTWWFLAAPYDENRSGWAAADFLTVVAEPTPQP